MGGDSSKPSEYERRLCEYSPAQHYFDPNIGMEVQVYTCNTANRQLAVFFLENANLFDAFSTKLRDSIESRKSNSHLNITNLELMDHRKTSEFCADSSVLKLAYQFSDETLQSIILETGAKSMRGVSSQRTPIRSDVGLVNSFLRQAVQGLAFFAKQGRACGFLKPAQVFVTVEEGEKVFKLLDFSPCLPHEDMYHRMLSEPQFFGPLDPTLIEAFRNKKQNIKYKIENDLWALGISALSLITCHEFSFYYDFSKPSIRYDLIIKDLSQLEREGYDSKILKIVGQLLQFYAHDRPNLHTLQEKYLPYLSHSRTNF